MRRSKRRLKRRLFVKSLTLSLCLLTSSVSAQTNYEVSEEDCVSTSSNVCYELDDHAEIMGMLAEGNECLELMANPEPPAWYTSKWFAFGIGLVVGGGIGYAVGR